MTQAYWKRWLGHLAMSGALGLALLAIGSQASLRAQDDDDNAWTRMERKVWRGFVNTLGLRSSDDPGIEYRERSPLVIPPSRDLPPPQAKMAPRDPAWPDDPDAKRQRRTPSKRSTKNASALIEEQSRPLTPSELNPAGARPVPSNTSNAPPSGYDPNGRQIAPSELGYFGGLFSLRAFGFGANRDEVGTFTAEPPRATLVEPPIGYQTPSPAQPYGVSRRVEQPKVKAFDPSGER